MAMISLIIPIAFLAIVALFAAGTKIGIEKGGEDLV